MALINCPECNSEVSEYSNECGKCGFPMKKDLSKSNENKNAGEKKNKSNKTRNKIIVLFFLALCFGVFLEVVNNKKESNYETEINETISEPSTETNYSNESTYSNESSSSDLEEGNRCTNCNLGRYNSNGECSMCGGVSDSRVNQVEDYYKACEGCNGTGFRGDEICSLCEGRGEYRRY